MRILKIKLKNLNSLAGEWQIDLTHPDYETTGFFTVTGPTGAGKTTLFDAICLALYGRTPRLSSISKSRNEIMTSQTGDCYAQAVFIGIDGGQYECEWSQRRARNEPGEVLQQSQRRISEISGKILATKSADVDKKVEELTGMDFGRFTRSIMLPQGAFDAFVKASPKDRAAILEQITGTEIYARISQETFNLRKEALEKLRELETEAGAVPVLAEDEETAIRVSVKEKEGLKNIRVKEVDDLREVHSWRNNIEQLKAEAEKLAAAEADLKAEEEAFKPEAEKLRLGRLAEKLEPDFLSLRERGEKYKADVQKYDVESRLVAVKAQRAGELRKKLAALETGAKRIQEAIEEGSPLWEKVRGLDWEILKNAEAADAEAAACGKIVAELRQKKAEERRKKRDQKQNEIDLNAIYAYLTEYATDEKLSIGMERLTKDLDDLTELEAQKSVLEAEKSGAEKELAGVRRFLGSAEEEFQKKEENVFAAETALQNSRRQLETILDGKLLTEYRLEKESRMAEKFVREKVASFEEERARLADGCACPLCGALEHPFAKGNVPQTDELDDEISRIAGRIEAAEKQEDAVREAEKALNEARRERDSILGSVKEAKLSLKHAEEILQHKSAQSKEFNERYASVRKEVLKALLPFGIAEIPESIETLALKLDERTKSWDRKTGEKNSAERTKSLLDLDLKGLRTEIDVLEKQLKDREKAYKQLKNKRKDLEKERKDLFGKENPDEEEKRLSKAVSDTQLERENTRSELSGSEAALAESRSLLERLEKDKKRQADEMMVKSVEFMERLSALGFENEEAFLSARLSGQEKDALEHREASLQMRWTEIKALIAGNREKLQVLEAQRDDTRSISELEKDIQEKEDSIRQLLRDAAEAEGRLRDNEMAKMRLKDKEKEIALQKKAFRRWDSLNELIGSADGKKFREFAQSLTFDRLIDHANLHLKKLSGRYTLVRDKRNERNLLEFNVIDSYQAGEERSVINLSGGEIFIVSLALSLGLSSMMNSKVKMESLFLDEGFGTLDEETLETAINTLSELKQEGRLIGIISHVEKIKERIGTGIVIEKEGAFSSISGPGCEKIKGPSL